MGKLIGMRSCSGFQDLKLGSIVVCHYAMGLSFLALILLVGRLYDVDRQVSLFNAIASEWLPDTLFSPSPPDVDSNEAIQPDAPEETFSVQFSNHPSEETSVFITKLEILSNLKSDIEHIVLELSSARVTLILSVVFVLVYILSWWWMAFSINQAREGGGVSLKTLLLLTVFAAIDIAASSGFVLLRVIMYVMRDRFYPWNMRAPSAVAETDSIAGHAVLHLLTIQIYSVACVYSYYKKAKKGIMDSVQKSSSDDSENISEKMARLERLKKIEKSARQNRGSDIYEYVPRHYIGNRSSSHHLSEPLGSKPRDTKTSRQSRGRFSTITATPSTEEEDIMNELKIRAADMPGDMQRNALASAAQAIKVYTTDKRIAESIKQGFDSLYSPTWHCIVGRNWGSCVTHSKQCYIRIAYRDMTILLYRST